MDILLLLLGLGLILAGANFLTDGGVNWSLSDTLVVMPQEFKARGFSSIYVDKDNYMYLFGGKETNSSNVLNQIWRGRINRLGF